MEDNKGLRKIVRKVLNEIQTVVAPEFKGFYQDLDLKGDGAPSQKPALSTDDAGFGILFNKMTQKNTIEAKHKEIQKKIQLNTKLKPEELNTFNEKLTDLNNKYYQFAKKIREEGFNQVSKQKLRYFSKEFKNIFNFYSKKSLSDSEIIEWYNII